MRLAVVGLCLVLAIVLGLLIHNELQADEVIIKPFASDGCSAWPDGTLVQKTLWLRCCTAHDRAYWQGGTYQQRRTADQTLKNCVAEVGEPKMAAIMLAGVRVGGSPYWPTTFRWGYGWEWLRGYKAVSSSEQAVIDTALKSQPTKQ